MKKTNYQLTCVDDVRAFFASLKNEHSLNFHPDNDFKEYVDEGGQPTYTREEANQLNNNLEECFDICNEVGEDIYSLAMEEFNGMGIDSCLQKHYTESTGGGVVVDVIVMKSGKVITITDEAINVWQSLEEWNEGDHQKA